MDVIDPPDESIDQADQTDQADQADRTDQADQPTVDDGPDGGELDLGLIGQDLDGVAVALERLDAGTYWTDEVTGETIPDDRLMADPIARRAG